MQIVIDIDVDVLTRLFDNGAEDHAIANDDLFAIAKAIRKGTSLPKGRERLIKTDILDEIRAEIVDTLYVDSLIFGELIDFKNGKISADDVIEEFNQVARTEVLKIIDKYKESEVENE